jgi:hypothetical protein
MKSQCSFIRAVQLIAFIGLAFAASVAGADNTPPSPFQEKGAEPVPLPFAIVTPQQRTEELESWAKKWEQAGVEFSPQYSLVRFFWPADLKEFKALAAYSLLILTVHTHKSEELPLKRVYVRTLDREIPLIKLSSWRMGVDPKLLAYRIYGPYREDGFYLFPLSASLRVGQIQADFAVNRSSKPVLDLPAYEVPGWLKKMQSPDPKPNALPEPAALERLIRRNTAGYPPIDWMPGNAMPKPQGVVSEPKPKPEPLPQLDEARKPAATSKKVCSEGRCEP